MGSVLTLEEAKRRRAEAGREGKKVVFTNGCFDIIHRGHVEYLAKAKALGDILIVGMNSDASVRRIKGEKRPVVAEDDRAFILANLCPVDIVCLFPEDTPYNLIAGVVPDVLV
jgi:rfaE bifunctional protein nucleotidyltransferase chain/domain